MQMAEPQHGLYTPLLISFGLRLRQQPNRRTLVSTHVHCPHILCHNCHCNQRRDRSGTRRLYGVSVAFTSEGHQLTVMKTSIASLTYIASIGSFQSACQHS